MDYDVFEGKKSIRIMRGKQREDFNRIKKRLGLKKDIDLVTLSASIGLHERVHSGKELKKLTSLQKLADMSVFDDRRLYDYVIITCLKTKEKRLEKFEALFYTGFRILKEWFDKNGADVRNELEAFANLWDYVKGEK